jgi:hypothetical protein
MNLEHLIIYIILNSPSHNQSKSRLANLLYLIDLENFFWHHCSVTLIQWKLTPGGLQADERFDKALNSEYLTRDPQINAYGDVREKIRLRSMPNNLDFDHSIRNIADYVLGKVHNLYWDDLNAHVYNTEPIKNAMRYGLLKFEKPSFNSRR